MNIIFKTKKLQKEVEKSSGLRAKKLRIRLQQLADSEDFGSLKALPGHFHELTGDRKGQWSCSLDEPYRLIFQKAKLPLQMEFEVLEIVEIIEIVDYH